jgi:hypothetical protein
MGDEVLRQDLSATDYFMLLAPHPSIALLPRRWLAVPDWIDTPENRRCPSKIHLWAHLPKFAAEFAERNNEA